MSGLRETVDESDARACLSAVAWSGQALRVWAQKNQIDDGPCTLGKHPSVERLCEGVGEAVADEACRARSGPAGGRHRTSLSGLCGGLLS